MTTQTTFRKNMYGIVKVNVRQYNPVNYQSIGSKLKFDYGSPQFELNLIPTDGIKTIFQKIESQLGKDICFAGCCAKFVGNGEMTVDGEPTKTYNYQIGNHMPLSLVKGVQPFYANLYWRLLTKGVVNYIKH